MKNKTNNQYARVGKIIKRLDVVVRDQDKILTNNMVSILDFEKRYKMKKTLLELNKIN